jgi:hypothetical protein
MKESARNAATAGSRSSENQLCASSRMLAEITQATPTGGTRPRLKLRPTRQVGHASIVKTTGIVLGECGCRVSLGECGCRGVGNLSVAVRRDIAPQVARRLEIQVHLQPSAQVRQDAPLLKPSCEPSRNSTSQQAQGREYSPLPRYHEAAPLSSAYQPN